MIIQRAKGSLSDGLSNFLGPHEGRELELMASEAKRLAMFVEPLPTEHEFFDEREFDTLVEQQALVKKVRVESITTPEGAEGQIRRVLYAQASQSWRISAMLFIQDAYNSFGIGFSPAVLTTASIQWPPWVAGGGPALGNVRSSGRTPAISAPRARQAFPEHNYDRWLHKR